MKILALGSGFKVLSIEELCLARGIELSAYVEPEPENRTVPHHGLHASVGRYMAALFPDFIIRILTLSHAIFRRFVQLFRNRILARFGLGRPTLQGPVVPLLSERTQVGRVIRLSEVPQEDFDFIVIAHPDYERFRYELLRMGISRGKILSLVSAKEKCLKKLGPVKFLLRRKNQVVTGQRRRYYKTLPVERKVMEDIRSPVPLHRQFPLVEELVKSCKLALKSGQDVLPPYRTGSNWAYFIQSTRPNFGKLLDGNCVPELTEALNGCLRNWLTEGFGGEAAFRAFRSTPYEKSLNNLISFYEIWAHNSGEEADFSKLCMPPIGNPWGFMVEGALVSGYCFMCHYRAAFASRLLRSISKRPVAAEIGGGMGLLAYYLISSNENMTYVCFDLPECLFVASYYLSMAFPHKRILYFHEESMSIDNTILDNYDIILMPNYMLPKLGSLSVDMFLNTISLSEMDYDTILEYILQIERTTKHYFYHENLADFDFSYKNYPVDFFPSPNGFEEIMTAPSRWPCFSFTSQEHKYLEILYQRVTGAVPT